MSDALISDNSEENHDSEKVLLYDKGPLKVMFYLSIGPMIDSLSSAFFSVVDFFWIGKYIGKNALSAISSVFIPQYFTHGFSRFVFSSIIIKIGFLQGKKAAGTIPALIFDMIKMLVLFAFIVPAFIYSIILPVHIFLNTNKETRPEAYLYMTPILCGFIFEGAYQLLTGILLANGHSILFSVATCFTYIITATAFDPFFVIFLKTGAWGTSLAKKCAELVTSIIIIIYIKKKHPLLLQFHNFKFFSKFEPESKLALKVGLSALIIQITTVLPSGVLQKLLSLSSHEIGKAPEVMGTWSLMAKVYHVVICVPSALSSGVSIAAAFYYGKKNMPRMKSLFYWTLFICSIWSSCVGFTFAFYPRLASFFWSKDNALSEYIQIMIPPSVYTAFLAATPIVISAFLQAMDVSRFASLSSIIGQLLIIPLAGLILYFTNKQNPGRIVWCYCFSDSTAFIVSVLALFYFGRKQFSFSTEPML